MYQYTLIRTVRNLDESWIGTSTVSYKHRMTAIEGLDLIYKLLHTINFPRYVILFLNIFVLHIL